MGDEGKLPWLTALLCLSCCTAPPYTDWQLHDRNLWWLDNLFEVVGQRTQADRIWRGINSHIVALYRSASDCHRQCRGRAILSGRSNG